MLTWATSTVGMFDLLAQARKLTQEETQMCFYGITRIVIEEGGYQSQRHALLTQLQPALRIGICTVVKVLYM